jgi:hypothetical protein
MGEIDDLHDPEDQGQADGHKAIHPPHENSVDNGLEKKRKAGKAHEVSPPEVKGKSLLTIALKICQGPSFSNASGNPAISFLDIIKPPDYIVTYDFQQLIKN